MKIDQSALEAMDHRYRVALINSLSGYKSANLVGTVDGQGQTNLSIVSSCVHLGADPALMAFVVRPHSVERHTLENLLEIGHYTLNQVHEGIYKAAHQTSARYPKDECEFAATGLTPEWRGDFPAPYVQEARLAMGMRFREHHSLTINGTEFIIGEIQEIWIPEEVIGEDGYVDLDALGAVCVSSLDGYHTARRLARLSYAKPDREPREIG